MAKLVIEGGNPLQGTVQLHGAKNSVLPLLAASLLLSSPVIFDGCPNLSDVAAATAILTHLGCAVYREGDVIEVTPGAACGDGIPASLMREMRSSIVFLGPMLARCGRACLSLPGGCELGPRPIDLHLSALEQLGARVVDEGDRLCVEAPNGLKGACISLAFPSVGATQNAILAAVLAKGDTVVCNAAREPEVVDLCRFLKVCGADIRGIGDSMVTVRGVPRLIGCRYTVMPDRIEAATYLAAAAVSGGDITVTHTAPSHLTAVLSAFEEAGCCLSVTDRSVRLKAPARLRPLKTVRTMPYPGFPTDAQAPIMAMAAVADGTSLFIENIFDSRYKHVCELMRMGAQIKTEGRAAVVQGVPVLCGTEVHCTDLRGGAALIVAAMGAKGTTTVDRLCHLDRGYADLAPTLQSLGACVRRETGC